VYGNFRMLIISIHGQRTSYKEEEMQSTKIDDIEHPSFPTLAYSRDQLPIITRTDPDNRFEGRPIVLDKFDTLLLLLPQFEVSVQRSCHHKTGSARSTGSAGAAHNGNHDLTE